MMLKYQGQRETSRGLTGFLVLLLTSALFAAPRIASLQDFGHTHTGDVPTHAHQVDATLHNPVLTEPFTNIILRLVQVDALPRRAAVPFTNRLSSRSNSIRAPPSLHLP